jgi:hypothetical protein
MSASGRVGAAPLSFLACVPGFAAVGAAGRALSLTARRDNHHCACSLLGVNQWHREVRMRRSQARTPIAEAFNAHDKLIAALQPHAVYDIRPKGTVLFQQGEGSRGVFLLLDGQARLLIHRDDGRTVPVRCVGPGYLLGLPGTILNRAYLFTAKLTKDSRVAFIPTDELLDFLRQRSDICFDVVEMLGGELLDLPPAIHPRSTRARHHRHTA